MCVQYPYSVYVTEVIPRKLSLRSGLEREDMQVFYHYLTTMLFPKHLVMSDVEVRVHQVLPRVHLSVHRSGVYSRPSEFSQQQCTVVL